MQQFNMLYYGTTLFRNYIETLCVVILRFMTIQNFYCDRFFGVIFIATTGIYLQYAQSNDVISNFVDLGDFRWIDENEALFSK